MTAQTAMQQNILYMQQIKETLEKHRDTLTDDNIQKLVRCAEGLKADCEEIARCASSSAAVLEGESTLSGRERMVYTMAMQGMKYKQIAEELNISIKTVQVSRNSALQKLGEIR